MSQTTLATPPAHAAIRSHPVSRRRAWLYVREAKRLGAIAAPITLGQLGAIGMNTMDTVMVGPLGPASLAAIGLGSALHMAVLMVCSGTIFGMSPLVSQAFGGRNMERAREVLVQGIWLSMLLAIPVAWSAAQGEWLAGLLGQSPEVAGMAGGYLRAIAWGCLPILVFTAARQYLEGMGIAKPAMVITFLGLGVNYFANRAFIYGVEGWIAPMGAVGTGWSTTMVRWVMCLAMLAYVLRHPSVRAAAALPWRPSAALMSRIAVIGWPAGAQIGLEVGLFSFAAVMMGWFGAVELGTHQVTINLAATTFMVALGASMAGAIRVGHHIGAGNRRGMRRSVLVTYGMALTFMGACAAGFLLLPEHLLGLYTADPEVIRLGTSLLLVAALFQLFDGAQVAGFCVLRGAADTRVPMGIAAASYWVVGAPAAYLLGFHTPLGPSGVWLGLCAGLATAAVLLVLRVRSVLWLAPAAGTFRMERGSPTSGG
jgi:multidrug resistance protein, MATE family